MVESREDRGKLAQKNYKKILRLKNPNVLIVSATPDQDMKDHWDYKVSGRKKDIKNNFFYDVENRLCIILEIKNVNGEYGSLFGKADDLVFQIAGKNDNLYEDDNIKEIEFIEIPRLKLVGYYLLNVDVEQYVSNKNIGVNKLFSSIREYDCDDVLTAVPIDELYKFGKIIRL
jgi:hypothetical protein